MLYSTVPFMVKKKMQKQKKIMPRAEPGALYRFEVGRIAFVAMSDSGLLERTERPSSSAGNSANSFMPAGPGLCQGLYAAGREGSLLYSKLRREALSPTF